MIYRVSGVRWLTHGIVVSIVGWLFLSHASAQSLYWIGTAGFARSTARSVSADGTTVVGSVQSGSQSQAFRWKHGEGLQLLGALGGSVSWGGAVSDNGQIVVGSAALPNGTLRAFRWSEGDGMQSLGNLGDESSATAVSADGSVIIGGIFIGSSITRVFRWQPTTGMEVITPSLSFAWANAISADGTVVVGVSEATSPYGARVETPFRWSRFTGMQYPLLWQVGEAFAVSPDGRTVVGALDPYSNTPRGFYWSYVNWNVQLVGDFGGRASEALGVSLNNAVVGRAKAADGTWLAFRWTPSTGLENLNQTYRNLLSPGSVLQVANGISWDGRYIVGQGFNSNTGRQEGYLLDTWRFGDTNGDGCIDDTDLLNVLLNFGTSGSGLTRHEDINKDGIVDDADLLSVLLHFGC